MNKNKIKKFKQFKINESVSVILPKKLDITKSEYKIMNTTQLMNFPVFYKIMNELSPDDSIKMGSDCTEKMMDLYGKPNFSIRGEYYVKIWGLEYKGYTFFVITAPDRGSSYEVKKDNVTDEIIREFVDFLLDKVL